MKPLVINIKAAHEPLLAFLFPTYCLVPEGSVPPARQFIAHKQVTTSSQRDALSVYYEDCVFISSQIFDEFWDESVLIQKCIEYSRATLRNRKSKLIPSADTFVEDCVGFMYNTLSESEEASVNQLFESWGTKEFITEFLTLSLSIPVQILNKSMTTFISKVLKADDSSSVYYQKKALVYAPRIRANLVSALDEFNNSLPDPQGLHYARFFQSLSRQA